MNPGQSQMFGLPGDSRPRPGSPAILLTCLALLAGCGKGDPGTMVPTPATPPPPQEVLVFAAASTTEALQELARGFEAEHPRAKVRLSFGGSSALANQIAEGAPADLFLSANREWVEHVAAKGLVAKQRDLLGNTLVVVVAQGSPLKFAQLSDLTQPGVKRLALADPEAVPAGIYAKAALDKGGVWNTVQPRIANTEDVRQALVLVETGAAQAAIVYRSDLRVSDRVRAALEIDSALHAPIRYPLALLKPRNSRALAPQFFEYCASPAAAGVFRKHGFEVLTGRN